MKLKIYIKNLNIIIIKEIKQHNVKREIDLLKLRTGLDVKEFNEFIIKIYIRMEETS